MRLKSNIWVAAYLRRCQTEGVFGAVRRRGAEEAGAVFVKVSLLDGNAMLYVPAPQTVYDDGRPVDRFFVPVCAAAAAGARRRGTADQGNPLRFGCLDRRDRRPRGAALSGISEDLTGASTVIASVAKQSRIFPRRILDCFVARAPRNDELGGRRAPHTQCHCLWRRVLANYRSDDPPVPVRTVGLEPGCTPGRVWLAPARARWRSPSCSDDWYFARVTASVEPAPGGQHHQRGALAERS
jgi:hypothetical protein